MPMYDRICTSCRAQFIDLLEPITPPTVTCNCGGTTERAWLSKPSAVIGDECDITIEHGLCDAVTGEPVRYTSKAEIAAEAKRRGLTPYVRHVPFSKGSDKSPHTTNWAAGIDAYTLENARILLSRGGGTSK